MQVDTAEFQDLAAQVAELAAQVAAAEHGRVARQARIGEILGSAGQPPPPPRRRKRGRHGLRLIAGGKQ